MQTSIVGRTGSFVVKCAVPVTGPAAVGSIVTVKLVDPAGATLADGGVMVIVVAFVDAVIAAVSRSVWPPLFWIVIVAVVVAVPAAATGGATAQPAAGAVTTAAGGGGRTHAALTGRIVSALAAVSVQPVSTFRYVTLTVMGCGATPVTPPTVQGAVGNTKLVGNVTLNVTGEIPSCRRS
jgi:hypothetical protein